MIPCFRAECSALELQASLVEFFARAAPELLGRSVGNSPVPACTTVAERIRERLEADQSEVVDLAMLAREVGLSRFATLRASKRQFGARSMSVPRYVCSLGRSVNLRRWKTWVADPSRFDLDAGLTSSCSQADRESRGARADQKAPAFVADLKRKSPPKR